MSLLDDLQQHATRVSQQLAYVHNEDQTKTSLILPFIRLLGYDVFDASEVLPEYAADFGTKRGEKIDYVVIREGKPALLIEAKSARTALHTGHASQLYRYYSTMDTRIGILTNGKTYQLFADLNKTNVMDQEPFIVIDMLDFDERMVGVIEGLTKAGYDPELVLARARELNIRREIRARIKREFESPSADLVKHFARGLFEGEFSQVVRTEFAPIVKQEWQSMLGLSTQAPDPPPDHNTEPKETPNSTSPDVKRAIDEYAGLEEVPPPPLPPPPHGFIPIYGYRDGHRFKAELSLDSVRKGIFLASKAVRYQGKLMRASDAVWNAIRSVDESFDSETWNKEKINSWRFWHVVDPLDGSEREMRLVAGWKHNRDEALYQRILSN